jgi:hypothetical protein
MLKHEQDSNVAEWTSQYPSHSAFINTNRHIFSMFPPAKDDSTIKEGEWQRIVQMITGHGHE